VLSRQRDDEQGQLSLLVIGYATIAAVLVVIGIDVSKVFLARRALASAADSAALAGAQAVDRAAIYAGQDAGCGGLLPLDGAQADALVRIAIEDDRADLEQTFAVLDSPSTVVEAGTVSVHLSGNVAVPFGHVLAVLLPGHADGRVQVDVTSSAQSPLTVPGGC
jgi:uncharacterized membrane protein